MDDKLLLKLTSTQRQLLLDYQHYIIDEDIIRAISLALKKGNNYEIYLSEVDFDLLIGYVCGIANHEEDKKVAEKFHKLSDYLEDCFAEFNKWTTTSPNSIMTMALRSILTSSLSPLSVLHARKMG